MYMKAFPTILITLLLIAIPASASALEVSGWLPYWRPDESTKAARANLSEIDTLHPFGFGVKNDGSLVDLMDIEDRSWSRLITQAQRRDVLVIPTVTWSNTPQIHTILSTPDMREEHIEAIVDMVEDGDFDGVDINYEGKLSATKDYFSVFLKELRDELPRKSILSCTIEARTPPESLYRIVPDTIAYANDYEAIDEACDRINIMTYDQQRADIAMNDVRKGAPYIPVSDAEWVRKVIDFSLESFPADKIYLGVATYGHEYEVVAAPEQYLEYRRVGAYNIPAMENKAAKHGIVPTRAASGEMSFSYSPLLAWAPQFRMAPTIPAGTSLSNIIGAWSLDYATKTGQLAIFNYVTWSDAGAIEEKIDLAKEYDLAGIAIFKIDGDEDEKIWEILEDL